MTGRLTASDRFRRIVSIVPWVAERDGPTVDEICSRFGIERADLLADLDVVFMVGIPPYTPDELIDVIIEDDRVWITLGRYFTRPLRLTAQEGLAVLAAGEGLLATTGSDRDGPLARALAKVRSTLGVQSSGALEISLGTAEPELLAVLRDAVAAHQQLEIDYYTYSTDESRSRRVDPYRVYASDGHWYLLGWCHHAEAERIFRVDRMRTANALDARFDGPTITGQSETFSGAATAPRIQLELEVAARWIIEHYPVESIEELPEGRCRVVLAVGGDAWLERLLLRLGPAARVVDDPSGSTMSPAAANLLLSGVVERMLANYRV